MLSLSDEGTNPQSASMMKDNHSSSRRSHPMVPINLSSLETRLTKTLLEKHDAYQEIDEDDE